MSETYLLCPCKSNKNYAECCEAIILGQKNAETPEALMRSRYTAFTQANIDYLIASMSPELANHIDRHEMQDFADNVKEWLTLEIIDAPATKGDETEGFVEFAASFHYEGKTQRVHERSRFIKLENKWFYDGHEHQCGSHDHDHHHDHHAHSHSHTAEKEDKIGRNDPCPCGSGRKYKKCCLE